MWGIDGNFDFRVMERNTPFATTDHCGCIRIFDPDIDPYYLYYYLTWVRSSRGLDRSLRANLKNMKELKIVFPVKVDDHGHPLMKRPEAGIEPVYHLDLQTQQDIARHYRTFEQLKKGVLNAFDKLSDVEIPPLH